MALARTVRAVAPATISLPGIGVDYAGQLLVTAGQNPERLKSESKPEIMRCPKWFLAREVYHALRMDLHALEGLDAI